MKAIARLCFIAAIACVAGCGSSASQSVPFAVPTPQPTTLQAGATIGGTVNAAAFTVPAGQTTTISSNLTVVTTGNIEIDGTLMIPPGIRIALLAGGSLTVNGAGFVSTQSNQKARETARHRQGHRGSAARGRRTLQNPAPTAPAAPVIHVFVGSNVSLQSTSLLRQFNPGDGMVVATSSGGSITLGGHWELADGLDGANPAAAAGTQGGAEPGGSIEIGTDAANTDAQMLGRPAARPALVSVNGFLGAGDGGWGASDLYGTLTAAGVTMLGGPGAAGGNVNLAAAEFYFGTGAFVEGGAGGDGGFNGFDSIDDLTFDDGLNAAIIDSNVKGIAGVNLIARTGDGGPGGNVVLTPQIAMFSTPSYLGPGGAPGSLAYARAGNGGPGGNGGTTTVTVGNQGQDGTAANLPTARPSAAAVDLYAGGSGGNATTNGLPGGNGGAVSVAAPAGGPASAELTFDEYAMGANGYNGCSQTPFVAGTAGGNGGSLNVHRVPYASEEGAFDGGNGGSGSPPGGLGQAGSDDLDRLAGTNGIAGTSCTPPGPLYFTYAQGGAGPACTGYYSVSCSYTFAGEIAYLVVMQAYYSAFMYATQLTCPNGAADFTVAFQFNNTLGDGRAAFNVTAVAHGNCTLLVTGGGGQTATVSLSY